jgi:hypothetical protein
VHSCANMAAFRHRIEWALLQKGASRARRAQDRLREGANEPTKFCLRAFYWLIVKRIV